MKTLFCFALLLAATARAGTVDITLDSSGSLSGPPGAALEYFGTLTNNTTDEIFLNSFSASGLTAAFTINTFISNTPISLLGNTNSGSVLLFEVVIPGSIADGPYTGVLTLLGGTAPDAQDVIGSANFTANVASGVPEPQTGLIAGLGLAAVLGARIASRRPRL